jgi:aspartyl-tRNA(Asn)/glutamyl-tRNA(Gln) amidotransferase subunit C
MTVDKNTIQYIARLAKLEFTEDEAAKLAVEFEKILAQFKNIDKEDLTGLNLSPESITVSVLRRDEVRSVANKEELFQNAKQMRDGFLVIPKVLE